MALCPGQVLEPPVLHLYSWGWLLPSLVWGVEGNKDGGACIKTVNQCPLPGSLTPDTVESRLDVQAENQFSQPLADTLWTNVSPPTPPW